MFSFFLYMISIAKRFFDLFLSNKMSLLTNKCLKIKYVHNTLTENVGCCSIIWSIFIWHRKRNVGKVQTISENVYLNTCPKCNLNDCIKCSFIYIYYHKMCHRLKFNGTVHLQQLGIRPLPGLINVSIFLPGWFKNWLMINVNRKMFCRFSKWLIPAPGHLGWS